ncbi:hypothetical protein VaNZ11_003427 [Volvox africanus]|uniref:Uncharacterized protein n=1 Tax=Volvox africanus TaxID=51714 RepID=A0ABQ5RV90_9CHLO|nr:hypothetical protein VaNZ11_003427 [Volvox africanus]
MESDKQKATKSRWVARWDATRAFIVKNYLPIAFLVALGLALAWPVPGRFLANVSILGNVRICQVAAMVLVFLITGLQLNTSEVKRALALRNLPVLVYGFAAILIITPCLGFALRAAPLNPWEFATGLAIFTVAPTTLGVGVALTEACGGNRAMALLLTVGTNALAVFTMPPELRLLLPHKAASAVGVAADNPAALNMNVQITDLLVKLAITVLVPFIIGKVVREVWPAAEKFAKNHRVPLSLTSTTALAFVVWQTLSAARDLLLDQRPGPVFAMIGLAIAMHLAYLLGNYLVVWFVLRAPLREAIAVVIMSSQKSAPVVVTTITFMTKDAAQQGLLSLPSIVGQLCQIFIGAALAKWLSTVVEQSEQKEKAAAAAEAAAAGPGAVDDAQGGSAIGKTAPAAASAAGVLQLVVPVSPATAVAATCDILGEGRDTSKRAGALSESSAAVPGCLLDGDGDQTYRAQGRPQGGLSGEGTASTLAVRESALLEMQLPSGSLAVGCGGGSLPPVEALPMPKTPKSQIQTSPYQHIPGQTCRPAL